MPRYIDADVMYEKMTALYRHHVTMGNYSADGAVSECLELLKRMPTVDVVPKSEAERLEKALADKARECNMAVDKICLEHRAKIALLHSSHEAELATAKREVAWKIFAELDKMDIRIVRLLDAIKYMDLVKKYEYKNN